MRGVWMRSMRFAKKSSSSPDGAWQSSPFRWPLCPAHAEHSLIYSMTACSGGSDCLRSAALLDPIMIVSGIAHSVKIITIW